uniref:Autophagy-related protein 13 n=1 Tax=Anopheles culicifacies TaxID=139723 RepID=A0A182MF57_9DIPT
MLLLQFMSMSHRISKQAERPTRSIMLFAACTPVKSPIAPTLTYVFNISITDQQSILDVLVETKKILQDGGQHESIVTRLPLCVEISLQTAEGGSMILEFWTLSIRTDQTNAPQRANQVIYNRMSLLLKSLLSVTRVTPAYRVSRMKRTDSYDIYYRIYKGEPQTNLLDSVWAMQKMHSGA